MYVPYENLQRYRLPAATFPLSFTMHGAEWTLRTFSVLGAPEWRCYLEGPKTWTVCTETNEARLEQALRESGINVPGRTFVGSAFRHLLALGIAERLNVST